MVTEADLRKIVGMPLPGGEYTVTAHGNWLASDAVEGRREGNTAHPLSVYLAAARGKGMTWDELFALCGATAADGPMFGEHETVLNRPIQVGETFAVTGRFVSAERKRGRRAGVIDIVAFEVGLTGFDGTVAATSTNSIVFPRRNDG